jgi:hypothetical protein
VLGVFVFFIVNPAIILWTLAGVGFYIAYIALQDQCGNIYDSWIVLCCLIISIIDAILALIQSVQIFKNLVLDI